VLWPGRVGVKMASPITERERSPEYGGAISADLRVGLDLQGCLQYSTEGVVLCSGDQDWMASTVVGPVLFVPTYRRLRAGGERIGTLRTVGDAFRACDFAQ
jgi:hypothetical protein